MSTTPKPARSTPKNRELTWVSYNAKARRGGRWSKKIDGRRHYFGSAPNPRDRAAYDAALASYRQFIDSRRRREQARELRNDLLDQLNAIRAITTPEELAQALGLQPTPADAAEQQREQLDSDPDVQQVVDQAVEQQAGEDGRRTPVEAMVTEYLAAIDHRRQMTEAMGDATPKADRLGASAYRNLVNSANAIKRHFESVGLTDLENLPAVEEALRGFRRNLDAEVAKGKKSPSYAHALTRAVRPMFTSAWKGRHLAEMPRCIDEITRAPEAKPAAKPLDVEACRKLLEAAPTDLKAFILLGLNCGCYSVDISDMTASEITEQDGTTYLARRRSKTGAPGRWKLWPETIEAINAARGKYPAGRLFGNRKGQPLLRQTGKSTSDYIARAMLKLASETRVKASFSQLRDTGAAFVEAWGREHGDNLVTSAYLAHSDRRMARNYLRQEPAHLDTGLLDEATDAFRETLLD